MAEKSKFELRDEKYHITEARAKKGTHDEVKSKAKSKKKEDEE